MRPQTLLVTGGMNGNDYLSSTEILHHGQHKWHTAAELPHSLTGLRGINLDNKILMTGRHHPRSYIAILLMQEVLMTNSTFTMRSLSWMCL